MKKKLQVSLICELPFAGLHKETFKAAHGTWQIDLNFKA